jgi:hypothetical protein
MSVATLAIPKGKLVFTEAGEPIAYLRASLAARRALREWFDRVGACYNMPFLFPKRPVDGPQGFEIHYQEQPAGAVGLSAKIAEWGQDVPASIPLIFGLAGFVLATCQELSRRGLGDALVAPGLIRFVRSTGNPWRLVPLPCGTASVADWAQADPETWQWLPADAVLGRFQVDPVRALGGALYQAIVGGMFPESLQRRSKFARVLRGRDASGPRLSAAVAAALPRSFGTDAADLERLVLDCLQPGGRRVDEKQAQSRFEGLTKRLSTDRLIRYWGFENRSDIAAKLAEFARPQPPPETQQDTTTDWAERADDLVKSGDLAGALEAAWNSILADGPYRARRYLCIVQRIASRYPFPVAEARAAISRISSQFGDQLDEADALRLLHLRLRYLDDPAVEPAHFNRRYQSTWNEATAKVLQAWLLLRAGTSYNLVSKYCREARKLYEAMPERGGEAGIYALSYIDILDGIAHIGAVSAFSNASFYTDAFERFGNALELAMIISAEDEIRASFRWLGWLARFTRLYPDPPLSLIHTGIEAILRSRGLTVGSSGDYGAPEIPKYDEDRLFPL